MPFAKTWMDLETIILSGERHIKSEKKTDIIHYHLFVESEKMIQMNLENPDGLAVRGVAKSRHTELINTFTFSLLI